MRKIILLLLLLSLAACTRVETGEVGLRKDFNGQVSAQPLGTGFHQSLVGSVIIFSAREVLVPVKGLHPVTADKLPMEDVDIQFTYRVNPDAIPTLYTKYSASYNVNEGGEIFIMRGMVEQFVRSAVADAISKYPALKVNDSRNEIAGLIESDVQNKVKNEGLEKELSVGQIVFTNVSIPQSIVRSTEQVVAAQNAAKTAEYAAQQARVTAQGRADAAVITAEGEAKAIAVQAQTINSQGGANYIQLEAIRKWDGKLPEYVTAGGAMPFIPVK